MSFPLEFLAGPLTIPIAELCFLLSILQPERRPRWQCVYHPEEHFPALLLLFTIGKAGRCFLPPTSPLFAYNHGHGRPMPGATLRFTTASQRRSFSSLFSLFQDQWSQFSMEHYLQYIKNQTGLGIGKQGEENCRK